MKIGRTGAVGTGGGAGNVTGPAGAARAYGATRPGRAEPARPAEGAQAPVDVAAIQGIPESEITPRVRAALMALMGEVERLRDELKKSQARIEFLERQIERDDLTPCNNRRGFVHELTRQIDFTERYGEPSSLIYIDLNGFKAINDTHGHLAGDAVLIQVASVLMDGRRVAGVRSSDYVGRLGGDEFGVILAQADETRAWDKAVQLAGAIAATATKWKESELRVDAAYGVHTFRSGIDAMAALAAADADMYNRKRQRDKAK